MNFKKKSMLAAVLCLCLALLCACTGGGPEASNPTKSPDGSSGTPDPMGNNQSAMGRYMEEELPLPEGVASVQSIRQLADGTICLLGFSEQAGWSVWQSSDNASSWQMKNFGWINELNQPYYSAMAFDDKGGLYLNYTNESGEGTQDLPDAPDAPQEGEEGDTPTPDGDEGGDPDAADVQVSGGPGLGGADAGDGSVISFGGVINEKTALLYGDESGYQIITEECPYLMGLYAMEEDELLAVGFNDISILNGKTGETKQKLDLGQYMPSDGSCVLSDGVFSVLSDNVVKRFSLETGELLEEVPVKDASSSGAGGNFVSYGGGSENVLALQNDGSALLYGSSEGIFRLVTDGSLREQIVDGELTSLSLPSLYLSKLIHLSNGNFLMLCMDDSGSKIFRYAYDPDVPRVPANEITIAALEDNKTIRQAVGQYQLDNPDVKVNFRQLMADGITASDALRTLSTELLSGNGPDIFLLDGMPVQSYMDKGILLDLNELLGDKISAGEYFPNIASAYERDGKLYAMPGRFLLPMLAGDGTENVNTLSDFIAWLGGQSNKNIGLQPGNLMDVFYDMLAYNWFGSDGTLNEEAFSADMQRLGELADLIQDDEQPGIYFNVRAFSSGTFNLMSGQQMASIGWLGDLQELMVPYSVIDKTGKFEMHAFGEGQADRSFIPSCVLGINAASKNLEIAKDFVLYALSEKGLANSFAEGLPTNKAAFETNKENPYGDAASGMMVASSTVAAEEGEEPPEDAYSFDMMLEIKWPTQDVFDEVQKAVEELNRASYLDAVIRQMVADETKAYFAGEKGLDETLEALNSKLSLYLAE